MTFDKHASRDLTCIITICIFFIDGCVCSLVPIILCLAIDLFSVLFTFILEQANVADFMVISESKSALIGHFLNPIYTSEKTTRYAKCLAPCLNHFGTTLPIYKTQNKRFFSSWARFQRLIGTPSLHLLFYSREMIDKQLAVLSCIVS